MPLFGKKKDSSEKKGYPVQATTTAYPVQQQAAYPTAPLQAQQAHGTYAAPPGAMGPPPPYAPPGQAPPPGHLQPTPYPQASPYPPAAAYPQAGAYPGQQPPPMGPGSTVVVQGGFDAGARFDSNSPPSIPPPPPGVAPNTAQMAVASGASNVQVTQQQSNWMTGGSDGGYTVW